MEYRLAVKGKLVIIEVKDYDYNNYDLKYHYWRPITPTEALNISIKIE